MLRKTVSKNHNEKKDSILNGATKVFAEIGFDRASMNQVASECGASKAALYHYFSSKNELLYAVLERHLKGLWEHTISLKKGNKDNEGFLYFLVEEILLFYQGNDDVHELQMHALSQLDEKDQAQLRVYMRNLVAYISERIREVRPTAFADKDKLRMATMSLFGMLNWYYTWNRKRGVKRRMAYARYATDLLLRGLHGFTTEV